MFLFSTIQPQNFQETLPMPKIIISDTSCFTIEYGEPLPEWVEIVSVTDKSKQLLLELQIDKGESSAIALAMETPDSTLILDDNKARRIANQLALTFTGTIGVIVKAKLKGIIPTIKPLIAKIKQTDFRLTDELEHQALKQANE